MDPVRIGRLRELVGGWVESGDTPSMIVLVARRGVIVLHEAFGVRRHGDTDADIEADSIFPLASCSKPITAAAVMCLVDDGLIGLNRPFIDYIPELDVPGVQWLDEARVADLLCHTSGIDDLELGAFIAAAAQAVAGATARDVGPAPDARQEDPISPPARRWRAALARRCSTRISAISYSPTSFAA